MLPLFDAWQGSVIAAGGETLTAPMRRYIQQAWGCLCSAEVPMPYARHLEEAALPNVPRIVEAARALVQR